MYSSWTTRQRLGQVPSLHAARVIISDFDLADVNELRHIGIIGVYGDLALRFFIDRGKCTSADEAASWSLRMATPMPVI